MAGGVEDLVKEFSSLLDESIILSISGDYDLANKQELEAVRDVLLTLAKDVEAEEATGFNPSGLGAQDEVAISEANADVRVDGDPASVGETDLKSNDGLTGTTESSQPMSSASATSSSNSQSAREADEPAADAVKLTCFDELNEEETVKQLAEMFSSLKLLDVRLALKKVKGDVSSAMDELLSLQWLESSGERVKGVDGFAQDDEGSYVPTTKKRKGKKKGKTPVPALQIDTGDLSAAHETPEERAAREKAHRENVEYLAQRLNLSEADAARIYAAKGNSMGASIVEVVKNYMAFGVMPDSSSSSSISKRYPEVEALAFKYSWVPSEYFAPIFEMTRPAKDFAVDLIKVLADYYEKPAALSYEVAYNVVAASPHSASFDLHSPLSARSPATPSAAAAGGRVSPSWASPTSSSSLGTLSASRDHSAQQAHSAFRQGRSTPLMRQAGGFYADRAREQSAVLRAATSRDARRLVAATATPTSCDLHGVSAFDGRDIALERVRDWWLALGETAWQRGQRARLDGGYRVVTGRGLHSAGGRSPLRSAVAKALVGAGWELRVETGAYTVVGRRRAGDGSSK